MTFGFLEEQRVQYNKAKERLEWIITVLDEDFVYSAFPCKSVYEDYIGVDDRAIADSILIGAIPYWVNSGGAITLRALDDGGGLQVFLPNVTDSVTILDGGTVFAFPWNVDKDIYAYHRFRYPTAADLLTQYSFHGFEFGPNDYMGLIYNTVASTDLIFETAVGGGQETTIVAPMDTDWWEFYMRFSTDEVVIVEPNRDITIRHTARIPLDNLSWELAFQSLGGANTLEIYKSWRLQDV